MLDNELKELLKSLPERKRRTFLRYINQKSKTTKNDDPVENKPTQIDNKEDFMKKLAELKVTSNSDDEISDEFDLDDEDDDSFDE